MEVRATGDTFHYSGEGEVELHYDASTSTTATLTITDSDGKVVYTEDLGQISEGEGSLTWDGKGIPGDLPEGDYSFSIVSTAENAEDVEITTYIEGRIDGMSYETGAPVPSIQGVPIELGDILEVRSPDEEDDE
ncbi:MAG: flagellar hook assembly protein FlgD [bacterium]